MGFSSDILVDKNDDPDLFIDVWEIFEKYVDEEDSALFDQLYSIAESIFDKDSKVWLKYADRPILDPEKAAAVKSADEDLRGLLVYVLTGQRPSIEKVNRGLSLIVDIKAVLDKGVLTGYYSEEQSVALLGGLLMAFSHGLQIAWEQRATFNSTPEAVALYNRMWAIYSGKFHRTVCLREKKTPPSEQQQPRLQEERLTNKEKAGLVLWGLVSIPAGIIGFILFMIPWVIAILLWFVGCDFLKELLRKP